MNRDYFRLEKRREIENIYPFIHLCHSLGVKGMDGIGNQEYVRGTEHVRCFGAREARLRWFERVQRRDSEYISRNMLRGRVT